MNEKELYEKQYSGNGIISQTSFPRLRKILRKFDVYRGDLAFEMLDHSEKLLDVGCGDGELVFRARKKFKEVYGIDISENRINRAKKRGAGLKNTYFSTGNINKGIDFAGNTFDSIICLDVLEHVFDPYFILSEINRALKQDGILILEVPNLAYLRRRLELFFGKFPRTSSVINWEESGWDGGHLRYFTYRTFRQLLAKRGFNIPQLKSSGLFGKHKSFWPSLLAGSFCVKAIKK